MERLYRISKITNEVNTMFNRRDKYPRSVMSRGEGRIKSLKITTRRCEIKIRPAKETCRRRTRVAYYTSTINIMFNLGSTCYETLSYLMID